MTDKPLAGVRLLDLLQVRIQDLCKGGPSRDFADIVQRSHGGSKNVGLKMGGRGGGGPPGPPDPHLFCALPL